MATGLAHINNAPLKGISAKKIQSGNDQNLIVCRRQKTISQSIESGGGSHKNG